MRHDRPDRPDSRHSVCDREGGPGSASRGNPLVGPEWIPAAWRGGLDGGSASGTNVGSFTASYAMPPPFAWTNQSSLATVVRANGTTVTGSGGDPALKPPTPPPAYDLVSMRKKWDYS